MVDQPERFIDPFLDKGADSLIAHLEVLPDPRPFLQRVRQRGKMVGLAIRPDTPVESLGPYLDQIDVALCMTVHPGFAGQAFLPESPARIRRLRQLIDTSHPGCDLEVDGGIGLDTVRTVVEAGATVLVAASAVFGSPGGPTAAVRQLLAVAQGP
jgi:ribulose-phosphate 3-epimerase